MPPPEKKPQPDPQSYKEDPYKVIKMDNGGISVCDTVDGEYQQVFTITSKRLTIGQQFQLFLGSLTIETVIRNIVVNVLQVDQFIKNMIISLLSKWIKFNDNGTIEIVGNVQMTGTAEFKEDVNFKNDVNIDKTLKVEGTAEFTDDIDVSGNAKFTEEVVLNNTKVIGKATFKNNVMVKGKIQAVGGITDITESLVVNSDDESDKESKKEESK